MPKPPKSIAPDIFAGFPTPYWSCENAALYLGDVRACLRAIPVRSVHTCITSPPYFGLRDYGTGTWEGGSAECDHVDEFRLAELRRQRKSMIQAGINSDGNVRTCVHHEERGKATQYHGQCEKCGARRVDMQIGAESSPDCGTHGQAQCGGCFVCSMVAVFREVRRVLRDDGTVWLNLGDSYSSGSVATGTASTKQKSNQGTQIAPRAALKEIPPGNLIGIPWRVALALQADGWVLRSDVPWVKRSAMPESCQTRPCKSLEYVFLLAKSDNYYFDMDAIRPASTNPPGSGGACFGRVSEEKAANGAGASVRRYDRPDYSERAFRNSDLWFQSIGSPHGAVGVGDELVGMDVTPSSSPGGANKKLHFAVFPPKLITPLILASTSDFGCCALCGVPYQRVAVKHEVGRRVAEGGTYAQQPELTGTDHQNVGANSLRTGVRILDRKTAGWQKVCGCRTEEVVPAVVLDPFVGSGTTVATALQLGRAGVGIDLSEAYLRENAVPRIEAALRGEKVNRRAAVVVADRPEDALPPVALD